MNIKKSEDALIPGYNGPIFSAETDALNEAWQNLLNVSEVYAHVKDILWKVGISIPGFENMNKSGLKRKGDIGWLDVLRFNIKGKGMLIIAFPQALPRGTVEIKREEIDGLFVYNPPKEKEGQIEHKVILESAAIYTKGEVDPTEIKVIAERVELRLLKNWKRKMVPYLRKTLGILSL